MTEGWLWRLACSMETIPVSMQHALIIASGHLTWEECFFPGFCFNEHASMLWHCSIIFCLFLGLVRLWCSSKHAVHDGTTWCLFHTNAGTYSTSTSHNESPGYSQWGHANTPFQWCWPCGYTWWCIKLIQKQGWAETSMLLMFVLPRACKGQLCSNHCYYNFSG